MHPPFKRWGITTASLVGLLLARGVNSALPGSLPSFSEGVATVPNPAKLQLSCGGEMPSLLGSEAQTKENLQAYYSYYRRRQRRLRAAEKDGVVLIPLEGDAKFRVLRATGMNGNMVYADGWNATHAMPSHSGVKSATPYSSFNPISGSLSDSSSGSVGGSGSGSGSASSNGGSEATGVEMGGALVWAAPPPNRSLLDASGRSTVLPCERRIGKGRLLVVANWFPGNFGHFLHDTLPLLLWLNSHPDVNSDDRFGLVDDWLHRTVLRWLDPILANRIVWLPLGTVNCVQGLVAVQYATPPPPPSSSSSSSKSPQSTNLPKLQRREKHTSVWELRNPSLFRNVALALEALRPASTNYVTPTHLRPQPTALPQPPSKWSSDSSSSQDGSELISSSPPRQLRALTTTETASGKSSSGTAEKDKGLILFYSRRSSRTQHGRIMSEAHEAACLQIIRAAMSKFQRPESLVVFNGQDKDGRKMSYENQFRTFRSAKLVLGPHGSGLANVLWMRPTEGNACSNAPAVLEFIADDDTSRAGVQPGSSGKSYFSLLGGVPWVRYYHMFLARNSTNSALFVDLHQLEHALDVVFTRMPLGNPPQPPPSTPPSSLSLSSSSSSSSSSMTTATATATAATALPPGAAASSSSQSLASSSQAQLALEAALAADAAAAEGIDLNQWALNGPWPDGVGIGGGLGGFVFVLATHKTGSTFLWKLFRGLAMRTQSCLLDGEKAPLPEDSASLLKRCPGGGGVLFTRKLVAPATAAKIASAMKEASVASTAVKREKLRAATAAPTTVADATGGGGAESSSSSSSSSSSLSLSSLTPPKVRCIVQTRNPYDVIVSQYQSFTLNHALPPRASLEAKNKEIAKRKAERLAGPDTYALKHWSEIKGRLDASRAVGRTFIAQGAEVLYSQYEDMTARPEAWATYLEEFLGLSEDGGSGEMKTREGGGGVDSLRGDEDEVRLRALRQRAWLTALALEQRTVVPSETSHTAYFMPGAHLKILHNTTLSWLY